MGALFPIDNLFLEFERLLFNLLDGPGQCQIHIGIDVFGCQGVIAPVDHYLTNMAVLFYSNDDVHGWLCAIENMVKFLEVVFYMLTDGRRDFNMTTGILKPHDGDSLLTLMNRVMLAKLQTCLASYENLQGAKSWCWGVETNPGGAKLDA